MMLRRLTAGFAVVLLVALAAPSFAQSLIRFTGQLLDVRGGYVYFSTGDAFKLADAVKIADYDTGEPVKSSPRAKMFARAILDPATKQVVELDITSKRLPADIAYASAAPFSATKPITERASEIVGQLRTGKEVPVAFIVVVPPTTALTANVYISTDASNWNPQAIKLDRTDGQTYRATRRFASGTKFAFRVTRGSWNSVELGPDGLQAPAHPFEVTESDARSARVVVFQWSDNRGNQTESSVAQPGALPTPYTDNPFGGNGSFRGVPLPPGYRPGGGQATPPPRQQTPPNLPPNPH